MNLENSLLGEILHLYNRGQMDKLFDYALISTRGNQNEWGIYRYNSDKSFDDRYDLVVLSKDIDIEKYIVENYWQLLS